MGSVCSRDGAHRLKRRQSPYVYVPPGYDGRPYDRVMAVPLPAESRTPPSASVYAPPVERGKALSASGGRSGMHTSSDVPPSLASHYEGIMQQCQTAAGMVSIPQWAGDGPLHTEECVSSLSTSCRTSVKEERATVVSPPLPPLMVMEVVAATVPISNPKERLPESGKEYEKVETSPSTWIRKDETLIVTSGAAPLPMSAAAVWTSTENDNDDNTFHSMSLVSRRVFKEEDYSTAAVPPLTTDLGMVDSDPSSQEGPTILVMGHSLFHSAGSHSLYTTTTTTAHSSSSSSSSSNGNSAAMAVGSVQDSAGPEGSRVYVAPPSPMLLASAKDDPFSTVFPLLNKTHPPFTITPLEEGEGEVGTPYRG